MWFSSPLFLLLAPLLVVAAPARIYGKRAASDVLVFKFADVLEQLESQFYTQALDKFKESDFTSAGFSSSIIPIEQFKNIQSDEKAHSDALQAALKSFGEKPITNCKFDFSAVLGDVATMAATARVVENVGVGAYLGGATLITDPVLLDAAGSILTIEARHQTILNVLSAGTAIPAAFDMPLTPSEVLAIASPFVSGCDLGIPANPNLAVTNTDVVKPGTKLTFKSAALNGTVGEDKLFCQMMTGGAPFAIVLPFNQCVVPQDINGPVGIWITNDPQPLVNNVRDRATNKQIAGPTMAYIDTKPESLGQLAKTGSGGNGTASGSPSESTSTQTISPDQASSVIAGAAKTGDAASASSTSSAAGGEATANAASAPNNGGGPNMFTGPSADGAVTVNGWTNV
jgi:hypothetical protein